MSKTQNPSGKPFTENWLQALTLSVGSPSARLVKPLINDIDSISQAREISEQLAAAERLWSFAEENKLTELLTLLPTFENSWAFSDEETLAYRREMSSRNVNKDRWLIELGLVPGEFSLVATITSGDWAELLRREAVRLRKTLSAQSMQTTPTLEKHVTAKWASNAWKTSFVDAEWVELTYEEPFETQRPSLETVEELIVTALMNAEPHLLPKALANTSVVGVGPWADSVERLKPLHHDFLTGGKTASSLWIRRTWAAVWPVIYREQNQLTKPCEIDFVRKELAECFQHVPKAVLWMFVAAKLVCSSQLGRGLSVCGNFQRG